jgi:hypothetical protein
LPMHAGTILPMLAATSNVFLRLKLEPANQRNVSKSLPPRAEPRMLSACSGCSLFSC